MALERGRTRLAGGRLSNLSVCITKGTAIGFIFSQCVGLGGGLEGAAGDGCLCVCSHCIEGAFNRGGVTDVGFSSVVRFCGYLVRRRRVRMGALRAVRALLRPAFRLTIHSSVVHGGPASKTVTRLGGGASFIINIERTLAVPRRQTFLRRVTGRPICFR